jgi:hypothetical protein
LQCLIILKIRFTNSVKLDISRVTSFPELPNTELQPHHLAGGPIQNALDPLLPEWVKLSDNPIVLPESGLNTMQFRDPTTAWRDPAGQRWLLVRNENGQARTVGWECADEPLHTAMNAMWECPDFFPVAATGNKDRLDSMSSLMS